MGLLTKLFQTVVLYGDKEPLAQYRTGIRLRDACLELRKEHQFSCAKMTLKKVIEIDESTDISGTSDINVLYHEQFNLKMVLLGGITLLNPSFALRKNILTHFKNYDVVGADVKGLLSQKVEIRQCDCVGDLLEQLGFTIYTTSEWMRFANNVSVPGAEKTTKQMVEQIVILIGLDKFIEKKIVVENWQKASMLGPFRRWFRKK